MKLQTILINLFNSFKQVIREYFKIYETDGYILKYYLYLYIKEFYKNESIPWFIEIRNKEKRLGAELYILDHLPSQP